MPRAKAVRRPRARRELFTVAKRFLPYIHSISGNAKLVHRVLSVELRWYWWDAEGYFGRQVSPRMIAFTMCGQMFHEGRARLCAEPKSEALLCGRCHGQPPLFGKSSPERLAGRRAFRKAMRDAHRRLMGKKR